MNIDLNRPVSEYGGASAYFKQHAAYLRGDLEENRLEVILQPAPEQRFIGHQVRRVVSENPVWYQNFYADTEWVRRDRTLNSLEKIVLEEDRPVDEFPVFATYDGKVRRLIHEHLRDGYESESGVVPPRNDYREVIGLPPARHGYCLQSDGVSGNHGGPSTCVDADDKVGEKGVVDAPF